MKSLDELRRRLEIAARLEAHLHDWTPEAEALWRTVAEAVTETPRTDAGALPALKGNRMTNLRLLDLFCCAGGAAMGYHRAGFEVVGVDIAPQPRYPFTFVQGDALEYVAEHGHEFDAIHASPPCQKHSTMTKRHGAAVVESHPDLIEPTRQALRATGLPYVIENVPGAPVSGITLCGSMFGLSVRRHRVFESNVPLTAPPCDHKAQGRVVGVYGHAGGSSKRDGITFSGTDTWREAMGIDWMVGRELAEAIPPAYTEHIGAQIADALAMRLAA